MCDFLKTFLPRLSFGLVGQGRAGVTEGGIAGSPASATTGVREGKTGEQVVTQAHGKYYEAVSRGNVYAAVNLTARSPGTALGATPPITLYNPVASGKRLAILHVAFGQAATGTLGTGGLFHTVYTIKGPVASQSGTAPVVGSGAVITPVNCLVGTANASVAQAFELGTLNANPAVFGLFANLSEVAGGTVGDNSDRVFEDVDGAITLAPGAGWALEAIMAAGSSPLGWYSVVWEEIPVTAPDVL
jgi:hypothetical protein